MDEHIKVRMKKCRGCGEVYPLTEEFWQRKAENRDGFNNFCKECIYEKAQEYAERKLVYLPDPAVWVDRGVCGVCGKALDAKERIGGFLCYEHKPPMMTRDDSQCWHCLWIKVCRERLERQQWVVCERPDSFDVLRATLEGRANQLAHTEAGRPYGQD